MLPILLIGIAGVSGGIQLDVGAGGWKSKYDKKRKPRVLRYSDFATREEFQAAVQEAIPIPRPPVVNSAEDLEDEDFIITNLLHLLDD